MALGFYGSTEKIAPPASLHVDERVLVAGVAEVHTIPAGTRVVVFSGTDDFWVRFDGAASIPVADVTDGSGSVFCPGARELLNEESTIGLIAPRDCVVSMEFHK